MDPRLFIATKAFIIRDGKVLVLRESGSYVDGSNVGRFDVPGGRLKAGERFDEALKREVLEETGLTVRVGRPIAVNEWRPIVREEPWQIVGIFFECEVEGDGEVVLSEDHDAFEWMLITEYETHKGLIENLRVPFAALAAQV